MSYRIIFVVIINLLILTNQARSQTYQRTYGSTLDDNGTQIIVTQDNNYAIIGSYGDGIYLIKTDTLGNPIWQKTFAPPNLLSIIYSNSFRETPDSGFVIAGSVQPTTNTQGDICLIKTNSSGDSLWMKFYGSPTLSGYYPATSNEIIITADGGYAIIGSEEGSSDKNVFLIKTDNIGNVQWSKSYGGSNDDEGFSLKQTPDGGYIIAGYTYSFGQGVWDLYLLKVNSAGTLQWTKTYGDNRIEQANHIEITNDGGFILTGKTSGHGTGTIYDDDLFLLKTDSTGNVAWGYTYGENADEIGTSVKQTADGGFIATGYTGSAGAGQEDVYLLKTDIAGNVLWSKTFGGSSTEQGNDVIQKGGNYLIVGQTRNFSKGLKDVYLIKTDSLGNDTCRQDAAITIKTILPWVQGTGGIESSGHTPKSDIIVAGNPDTTSYTPCICVPPVSDYHSSFIDAFGFFYDYSTWATTWFWDFGDGTTSIEENPNHGFPNGTFYVCLTVTNECGADTYCDSIFISVGINEIQKNNSRISIAPNPFDDYTIVRFENKQNEKLNLQLLNPLGLSVMQIDNITGNEIKIERNSLANGLYYIILKKEGEVIGVNKLEIR